MMRTARLLICAALALCASLHAQTCPSGWAHVTATAIQSIGRGSDTAALLQYGSFAITAQTVTRQQSNFSLPGGGISTFPSYSSPISNGAITRTICVPQSSTTTPQATYDITVRDTSSSGGNAQVIHLSGVIVNQAEWSFDAYQIAGPVSTAAAFTFTHGNGPPVGSCTAPAQYVDDSQMQIWFCRGGVWTMAAQTGGSDGKWGTITSDTNIGNTLFVGSGSTLAPVGTGTINATTAITAGSAATATHATSADSATTATVANATNSIAGTLAPGSNVTITGNGTTSSPYAISSTSVSPIGTQYRIGAYNGAASGGFFTLGQFNAYTDATGNNLTVPRNLNAAVLQGRYEMSQYSGGLTTYLGSPDFATGTTAHFDPSYGLGGFPCCTPITGWAVPPFASGKYRMHYIDDSPGATSELVVDPLVNGSSHICGNYDGRCLALETLDTFTDQNNLSGWFGGGPMGHDVQIYSTTPGLNTGNVGGGFGGWYGTTLLNMQTTQYSAGMANGISLNTNRYSPGDVNHYQDYSTLRPGVLAASDEGVRIMQMQPSEAQAPAGTVTCASACTGATTLDLHVKTSGSQIGDQTYVLDTTSNLIAGTVSSGSLVGNVGVLTVNVTGGTLGASVSGTTTAAIATGFNLNGTNSAQTLTMTTTSSTGCAVGDPVMVFTSTPGTGSGMPDRGIVLSASAAANGQQTLSMHMRYPHDAGASVACGAAVGSWVHVANWAGSYNNYWMDVIGSTPTTLTIGAVTYGSMALPGPYIFSPGAFTVARGCEVLDVRTPGQVAPDFTHVTCTDNNAAWTQGDAWYNPNHIDQAWAVNHLVYNIDDPFAAFTGFEINMTGATRSGQLGGPTVFTISNNNTGYSNSSGLLAPTFSWLRGVWDNYALLDYVPTGGSSTPFSGCLTVCAANWYGDYHQSVTVFQAGNSAMRLDNSTGFILGRNLEMSDLVGQGASILMDSGDVVFVNGNGGAGGAVKKNIGSYTPATPLYATTLMDGSNHESLQWLNLNYNSSDVGDNRNTGMMIDLNSWTNPADNTKNGVGHALFLGYDSNGYFDGSDIHGCGALFNTSVTSGVACTKDIFWFGNAFNVNLASGAITAGSATLSATTLSYLDATSSIQTQLNSKAAASSLGTMALQNASAVAITGGTAKFSAFNLALSTPSSSTNCSAGDWAADASYIYLCTATNAWARVALTPF